MEKLIELLNEWERERVNHNTKEYIKRGKNSFTRLGIIEVISKSYGFIKWLVENDKVDFDKCGLDIKDYLSYNKRYDRGIVMAENYDNDTFKVREFYSPYEQLVMLLSISDTPIDDLISYLR